jgi:hypothetical protein
MSISSSFVKVTLARYCILGWQLFSALNMASHRLLACRVCAMFTDILSYGNSQDVPLLTNGLRKCVFIHNGIQPQRRMKIYHL